MQLIAWSTEIRMRAVRQMEAQRAAVAHFKNPFVFSQSVMRPPYTNLFV